MQEKIKSFISIVFCVTNSNEYAIPFLEKITTLLAKKFQNYEFVCINNNSSDEYINKLEKIVKNNSNDSIFNIIKMAEKVSIDYALSAGVDLAIGDFVFEFDSLILDYDVNQILKAYQILVSDDIDIISLSSKEYKTFSQKMYYKILNIGSDISHSICFSNFRIVSRRAINKANKINKYISDRKIIYSHCGLASKQLYYVPNSKEHIKYNSIDYHDRLANAFTTIILYTNSIQRIFAIVFFIIFIFAILLSFILKSVYAFLFALFLLCFFISVSIIVGYLSTITQLIVKEQDHLIQSIKKVKI